ncbi:hypothetical protein QOZ80_2BG0176400 [Eleusine coracana subsp. coracana]|nr:hypothetical protein QOZ80_2BG0176400 [Eleusine coracana subsp. coracana]
MTGEMWKITIQCKGVRERIIETTLDKGFITFVNLMHFKEQLGYCAWDFLYYKNRCGLDVATLRDIDISQDVEIMVEEVSAERRLRLLLTKEPEPERHVNITPLKRPRDNESDDDEEDDIFGFDESVDAYKEWLQDLQDEDSENDLYDDYRD